MKKLYFFLTLLVALCCSTNVSAKKIIYSQNFETAKTVAETGWTSPDAAAGLSIGSDDFGKFLKFTHSANDRSAHMFWDADKIKNEFTSDLTAYTVSFQFCFNAFGNNHMTSEIALMSETSKATKKANSNYRVSNGGALFDLTQLGNTGKTAAATGDQDFAICGDSANYKTLTAGVYYNVTLTIDTLARTVEYTIQTPTADDPVASDTYTVPEGVDMTATGLYILAGRYAPVIYMDNIEVSVDKTEANTPTVTLTGINNAQRVYTIGIQEDETLHLSFNGKETTVNYSDTNEGSYTWSNNPNYDPNNTDQLVTDACEAGTLKAWTTLDNLKSDEVTVDVTNNIITLPTAAVDITNVTTGYAKTYHATCDNSNTPLAPTIYGTYKFTGKDGSVKESSEPTAFPFDIAVDQAGSLEITSQAFGYGSAQTTVENNVQYAVKETVDFAHLTEAQITAAGFEKGDNVTDKFATYGRFFGYNATDSAKIVYNEIPNFTKKASAFTDSLLIDHMIMCGSDGTATGSAAILPVNAHIYPGIGLLLDGKKGDDQSGSWISNWFFKIADATADDIITVESVSNYGSTSLHPVVASLDEYLAADNAPVTAVLKGDKAFSLYRVSDAIAKVTVYSAVTGPTAIKQAVSEVVKNNPNAPVYNLSGQRVNKNNLPKGVYIQNGKKFIVK